MSDWDMARMPRWLHWVLPFLIWRGPRQGTSLYLTFDDGPTAGVTESVLDCLAEYEAKATFFLLGCQIEKHPALARRVRDEGHSIGNHGYGHLNGWQTSTRDYVADFRRGRSVIEQSLGLAVNQFRPPYGRLSPLQAAQIMRCARIVMWDINAQDYRRDRSDDAIRKHLQRWAVPSSIVLMHDNDLTASRIANLLRYILQDFRSRGFGFRGLSV